MAGSNCDAAVSLEPCDGQFHAGCGTDTEINNLTARGEQSSQNRGAHHRPGGSGIATNENASAVEVCTKCLRESDSHLWSKRLTDDPAHAGDANLQWFHNTESTLPSASNRNQDHRRVPSFDIQEWRCLS